MRNPARIGVIIVLSGWAALTGLLIHQAQHASEARHQAVMNIAIAAPQSVRVPLTDTVSLTVSSWRKLTLGNDWSYVNASRGMQPDFAPHVTTVAVPPAAWYTAPQLQPRAARAFEQWAAAAEYAGYPVLIASAYRSGPDQRAVRDALVASYGAAYAERFSARPGYSEHQLGLAVDVTRRTPACEENFDNCRLDDVMAQWLASTAPHYGFILRYPPGKEHITGVPAESWHFRYVGKEMAAAVTASGLTFDEVIQRLEAYRQAR
ncbi:MAG: M15 family metallopeptidase [Candidatus Saccharibacteria bacterium]|nr:M15 family metallopeptidase [Candidatus Saccharibacteria bacterium]